MMSVRSQLKYINGAILLFILATVGCADPNFLDNSKKELSILQGEPVAKNTELAKRTVMLVQDIDMAAATPIFFGICTGVLIEPQVVLTAAHCVQNGISKLKIFHTPNPRLENVNTSKNIYGVSNYRVHRNYSPTEAKDLIDLVSKTDLAILYLDRPTPLQFYFFNELPIGKKLQDQFYQITVAGYGRSTDLKDTMKTSPENLTGRLLKADTFVHASDVEQTHFIIDQWEAPGVCKGDSGAPAFIKDPQTFKYTLFAIAIDVFKEDNEVTKERDPENNYSTCAHSGLYLNLTKYKNWIFATTQELHQWANAQNGQAF